MTKERTGFMNYLDTIDELTAARLQTARDYMLVAEIVATVLGRHDCDGVAIVALEVALQDYFYNTKDAYDREVNRRLEEMRRTTNIMSEAEED